jgi:hypothetical protein
MKKQNNGLLISFLILVLPASGQDCSAESTDGLLFYKPVIACFVLFFYLNIIKSGF